MYRFYNKEDILETIESERQTERTCSLCLDDYTPKQNIVLFHGKEYPTHNACKTCVNTFKLTVCPFCRKPLNIKSVTLTGKV